MQVEAYFIQQFNKDESGFVYMPLLDVDGKVTGLKDQEAITCKKEAQRIADNARLSLLSWNTQVLDKEISQLNEQYIVFSTLAANQPAFVLSDGTFASLFLMNIPDSVRESEEYANKKREIIKEIQVAYDAFLEANHE